MFAPKAHDTIRVRDAFEAEEGAHSRDTEVGEETVDDLGIREEITSMGFTIIQLIHKYIFYLLQWVIILLICLEREKSRSESHSFGFITPNFCVQLSMHSKHD